MIRRFTLSATDGAQVVPVPGGDPGFRGVFIAFDVTPSAGTVTVEQLRIGSAEWETVNRGAGLPLTEGQITLFSDGPISAFRVTFSGLIGGTAPALWLSAQPSAMPPTGLFTDAGTGPNARLRVDVAQTGFFAGREFRTFREWAAAETSVQVIKITAPINVILFEFLIQQEAGTIRVETVIGGTEGGTFAEVLPVRSANTMTEKPQPPYSPQVVLVMGGTLTGGTTIDVSRAKVAANSNFASTVGAEGGAERGVGPATYYWRITMTGFIGVIKARWEERPNGSQMPFP